MSTPGLRCAIALQEIGIGITQDTEQLASFIDEKIGESDQQEPVTEVLSSRKGNDTSTIDQALPSGTRLYTRPQTREWVGLTESEIIMCSSISVLRFYDAIEAKLREKNT